MRTLLDARRSTTTKGLIGLTFDDGYDNFTSNALPVLERLGFSATVFVVGNLPKTNVWDHHRTPPGHRMRLVEVADLRYLSTKGIEVGSHAMNHVPLAGKPADLLMAEIYNSREALRAATGKSVDGFCYPYGSVDRVTIEVVRKAGYVYACSVLKRPEGGDYDISRIPVEPHDSMVRFGMKLAFYSQYRLAKTMLRDLERAMFRRSRDPH